MTTLIQKLTDFIQFQWLSFLIGFHLWDFLCFVESLWFGNKSPKPKPLGRRVGNARKIWAGGQGQQASETKKPSQWTTGPTQTQPNPGNSSWSHEPMATRTHVSVSVGVRRGLALPALPPSVGRSLAGCGWLAGWLAPPSIYHRCVDSDDLHHRALLQFHGHHGVTGSEKRRAGGPTSIWGAAGDASAPIFCSLADFNRLRKHTDRTDKTDRQSGCLLWQR